MLPKFSLPRRHWLTAALLVLAVGTATVLVSRVGSGASALVPGNSVVRVTSIVSSTALELPDPEDPYHLRVADLPPVNVRQEKLILVDENGEPVRSLLREFGPGGLLIQEAVVEAGVQTNQHYIFKQVEIDFGVTTILDPLTLSDLEREGFRVVATENIGGLDGQTLTRTSRDPSLTDGSIIEDRVTVSLAAEIPGVLAHSTVRIFPDGTEQVVSELRLVTLEILSQNVAGPLIFSRPSPIAFIDRIADTSSIDGRSPETLVAVPAGAWELAMGEPEVHTSGRVPGDEMPFIPGSATAELLDGVVYSRYAVRDGRVTVWQGPSALLVPQLRRSVAQWTQARPDDAKLDGVVPDVVWIAGGGPDGSAWAFIEYGAQIVVIKSDGIALTEVLSALRQRS